MIDTTKDFSKYVGSLQKAANVVRKILGEHERIDWTTSVRGRKIVSAYGNQKVFRWYYDPEYKTLHITYTDGREKPIETEKPEFYVIWIEGLSPQRGEKIKSLDGEYCEYTTKMSEALRVKKEDIETVKAILKSKGVADWAINGVGTFHKVTTNPKGNLFGK
jgi:hypothetical protein